MKRIFTLLSLVGASLGITAQAYFTEVGVEMSACNNNRRYTPTVEMNPTSSDDPVANGQIAYGIEYSEGNLTLTWYNISDYCDANYSYVESRSMGGNHIFFQPYNTQWCMTDCICLFDVTAKYENVEPGEYVFMLDYVNYDVTLKEGMSVILTPEDASAKWKYSDGANSSKCKGFPFSADSENEASAAKRAASVDTTYGVKYHDGVVDITWYNVIDNCSVWFKWGSYTREDNKLTFSIQPVLGYEITTCICNFDVAASFEGIEPGHYTLVLGNNEFELDLAEGTDKLLDPKNPLTEVRSVPVVGDGYSVSNGVVRVNVEGDYTLEVVTLDGIMITSFSGSGEEELDLNALPKDVYIVRLTTDGHSTSRRIHL